MAYNKFPYSYYSEPNPTSINQEKNIPKPMSRENILQKTRINQNFFVKWWMVKWWIADVILSLLIDHYF